MTLALFGFVLAMDPYGLRTTATHPPTPIMDVNQRYMYPQLARSRRFDAAIFGTSTVRLLDPEALSAAFGGHFVNLGMNAGTPWEQMELAKLFLRTDPKPRMLIFGLDRTWCDPDANAPEKRITFRSFPPWLYDTNPWNDYPELLNLHTVEIAARVALHALGLMPERIRGDGYEVFTPPEASYDLARARFHIWSGTSGRIEETTPPVTLSADEKRALRFPALAWLDAVLDEVPRSTRVALVLPPPHVAAQARPGSREAAVDAVCKATIARIAARHGAPAVDFRFPSAITSRDDNYWDNLHYRLPIASRIVGDLKTALATGRADASGDYHVLSE